MEKPISIIKYKAIKHLPEDERKEIPGIWYRSQREHWLGWLVSYFGPGAYGRKNCHRDAKFVYNHVVYPGLILYLVHYIPFRQELIDAADLASQTGKTEMETGGAIRKVVPWLEVYQALWGKEKESFLKKVTRG